MDRPPFDERGRPKRPSGAGGPRSRRSLRRADLLTGACCVYLAGCAGQGLDGASQVLYEVRPPTWFEDGFSTYDVSPSGERALFRSWYGTSLIELGRTGGTSPADGEALALARWAVFDHRGDVWVNGQVGDRTGWFADGDGDPRFLTLPPRALPRWSPDGRTLALDLEREIQIGPPDDLRSIPVPGNVAGLGWAPDGEGLYVLVSGRGGSSSVMRVSSEGASEVVREGLDATASLDRVAVSEDGLTLYLALAGPGAPDNEARHDPTADRDTDIYALDLATGRLRAVVTDPGDDFYPVVAQGHLYWTHNEMREQVVVVPARGGEARTVLDDAQIPYWSPDGRRLGYTVGGWRIADWALNLDAAVVEVDSEGRPLGPPTPIVEGYHEDFTPVWSPDGKWIAYHSHRSTGPVAAYEAESSTDDIYLRSVRPGSPEIRLTDFGWEVGNPSWAPDSRRIAFDSQARGGEPFVFEAWIVEIDAETGQPRAVSALATPAGIPGFRILSWSPAGEEIGIVYPTSPGRFALSLLTAEGGDPRTLAEFEASTQGGLTWTPDGREIVYSALTDGLMQLFAIERDTGRQRRLTSDACSLILPQVSPDGRWIAATRMLRSKQLRRMPLAYDHSSLQSRPIEDCRGAG